MVIHASKRFFFGENETVWGTRNIAITFFEKATDALHFLAHVNNQGGCPTGGDCALIQRANRTSRHRPPPQSLLLLTGVQWTLP